MKWYLRSCPVCAGDLYQEIADEREGRCLMCGREFPVALLLSRGSRVEQSSGEVLVLGPIGESRWRGIGEAPLRGEQREVAAGGPRTKHAA